MHFSSPCISLLVADDFRYFEKNGTDEWKRDAPALTKLVEGLGQGHRVNHFERVHEELLALKEQVWQEHDCDVLGTPLHSGITTVEIPDDDYIEITAKQCQYVCG